MPARWLAGWRPYLLLLTLCAALYLPGIAAIPVLDRDEARFAQASRQMIESGDYLHIRFQDSARNNKPAGIYWLQAAAVGALSTSASTAIWPYRVPSLIGATLAVLLSFAFARALLGAPGAAFVGAVLLATALATITEAHIAKTDAALLAAIVAGQGALGLAYTRTRAGRPVGPGIAATFWLAEIAAIFLKGPIGPGVAIITAATLAVADRDPRWLRGLRPLVGIAATVLAVAPWLYAIEHATNGQFLDQSVGRDFWSKLTGGREAHGQPPLYYLGLAFLTFWPGSLLLVPAVIQGWRKRAAPATRFLLAWLIPAWIVLELVPTKLPHYALPLYPALAMLAAMLVAELWPAARLARGAGIVGSVLWLLATLLIAAALVMLPIQLGEGVNPIGVLGAAAIVVLAAVFFFRRDTVVLPIGLALTLALSGGFVVPGLDRLWLSRAAAALVAAHKPPDGAPLAVIGYNEPSLVFLLDDKLRAGMADVPVAAGDEALVANRYDDAFKQVLAARGLAAEAQGSVAGTDYSNGERMTLTLYRIAPK